MVATDGLLLFHMPIFEADKCKVLPIQIPLLLSSLMAGLPFTMIGKEGSELQPSSVVNIKVTIPCANAVTIPVLVIVAMSELLLTQFPPDDGTNDVVPLIHSAASPCKEIFGR